MPRTLAPCRCSVVRNSSADTASCIVRLLLLLCLSNDWGCMTLQLPVLLRCGSTESARALQLRQNKLARATKKSEQMWQALLKLSGSVSSQPGFAAVLARTFADVLQAGMEEMQVVHSGIVLAENVVTLPSLDSLASAALSVFA